MAVCRRSRERRRKKEDGGGGAEALSAGVLADLWHLVALNSFPVPLQRIVLQCHAFTVLLCYDTLVLEMSHRGHTVWEHLVHTVACPLGERGTWLLLVKWSSASLATWKSSMRATEPNQISLAVPKTRMRATE